MSFSARRVRKPMLVSACSQCPTCPPPGPHRPARARGGILRKAAQRLAPVVGDDLDGCAQVQRAETRVGGNGSAARVAWHRYTSSLVMPKRSQPKQKCRTGLPVLNRPPSRRQRGLKHFGSGADGKAPGALVLIAPKCSRGVHRGRAKKSRGVMAVAHRWLIPSSAFVQRGHHAAFSSTSRARWRAGWFLHCAARWASAGPPAPGRQSPHDFHGTGSRATLPAWLVLIRTNGSS